MANTLPKPDHRMQIVDADGKMTDEFFRLILLIVVTLNALP